MDTPANQKPGNHEREGTEHPGHHENEGPEAPRHLDKRGPERVVPPIDGYLRKVGLYSNDDE